MTMKLQNKAFSFEVKEVSGEGKFSGYASVFNVVDYYGDKILPGAFSETVSKKTPPLLWQHDNEQPIGAIDTIFEDTKGLFIEAHLLLDIPKAAEAFILLKNNVIKGLSIGYIGEAWEFAMENDLIIRVLKKIDLWEVSLVTFPANEQALVGDVKGITNIRDAEKFLREAGFSRSEAKAVIAAIKSGIRCDDEDDEAIIAAKSLLSKMKGAY